MAEDLHSYETLVLCRRLYHRGGAATPCTVPSQLHKPVAEGNPMSEQQIVGEQVAGRAASVRRDLLRLSGNISHSVFDLADLLFEAREGNYYAGWGFSSLAEYAKVELGLKQRKAEYMVRIVRVMKSVGLKRSQYEPCGISKLRDIATLNPEASYWNTESKASEPLDEHIVRLVLDHDKLTVEATHDEVLRLQGRTGPDSPVTRSTTYPKSVWENIIKPARELARQMLGSAGRDEEGQGKEYSDAACDEVIFADFLADPNHGPEPLDTETEESATIVIPTEGQ